MKSKGYPGAGDRRIAAALDGLPVNRGFAGPPATGAAASRGSASAGLGRAVHPELRALFPGGLQPEVYTLSGSASVGLGLLVDGWCGVVGLPELGVEAARGWGVELSRLVLIPDPGPWLETVAELIEGLDVVLAAAPPAIAPAAAQRLVARLRSRRTTLVVLGRWPHAQARIDVRTLGWEGLGEGYGALEVQRLEVAVTRHHSRRAVTLMRGARGITALDSQEDGHG